MVRFGESSIYSGASLISLIRRASRVQSSSFIRPERISASLIFASADSSRITISDLLISSEKMTLAMRCLIEHDRKKSNPSVDLPDSRSGRDDDHLPGDADRWSPRRVR